MAGPWTIETVQGKRYRCFQRLCMDAAKVARKLNRAVLVKYHGPRRKPNRDPLRSHFKMHPPGPGHPRGRRDLTVDPTWHARKKR